MPELTIRTNVKKNRMKSSILQDLSKLVAETLGKSEKYVSVLVEPGLWMSFGGTEEPCALCSISSVGQFDTEFNQKVSAVIMKAISDATGVPDDRMYLLFNRLERQFVGYKSNTFYGALYPSKPADGMLRQ